MSTPLEHQPSTASVVHGHDGPDRAEATVIVVCPPDRAAIDRAVAATAALAGSELRMIVALTGPGRGRDPDGAAELIDLTDPGEPTVTRAETVLARPWPRRAADLAAEESATLLVVALADHRSRAETRGVGELVRSAPCPVLVVPPD